MNFHIHLPAYINLHSTVKIIKLFLFFPAETDYESDYTFIKKNNLRVSEEPEANWNAKVIADKIKVHLITCINSIIVSIFWTQQKEKLDEIKNVTNSNEMDEDGDSLDALYESLNPDDDAHF